MSGSKSVLESNEYNKFTYWAQMGGYEGIADRRTIRLSFITSVLETSIRQDTVFERTLWEHRGESRGDGGV